MKVTNDNIKANENTANTGSNKTLSLLDVIKSVGELKILLRKETELLKELNYGELRELHDAKMKLVRKIELQNQFTKNHPDMVIDKSEFNVAAFQRLEENMDKVLKENFHEVLKVKEINRQVVEAVSKAVSQHDESLTGYGQGLGYTGSSANGKPAIALNRII